MTSMKGLSGVLSKRIMRRREVPERAVKGMDRWKLLAEQLKVVPTLQAQEAFLTEMESLQAWEPDLAFADWACS